MAEEDYSIDDINSPGWMSREDTFLDSIRKEKNDI